MSSWLKGSVRKGRGFQARGVLWARREVLYKKTEMWHNIFVM